MKHNKHQKRIIRHRRVRAKVIGAKKVPRVSVYKSNQHIFVQFIDDVAGKTILSNKIGGGEKNTKKKNKTERAAIIGEKLAKEIKEIGIKRVVFDRGGFKYHGRIRALADGLRKGGLEF